MSCLGRERVFEHFSRARKIPLALIRLNYACELRYGVLVDIAGKIWREEPVDLSMGHFNIIWQGDANAMTLAAFGCVHAPPFVVNVTGPEQLSVRWAGEGLGQLLNKEPRFTGVEGRSALLSNAQRAFGLWGKPCVNAGQLMIWVADWVRRGGPSLNKPTHFESRDGKF